MEIRQNIYSVGAVDKDVRIFHGYLTPYGTTYNSYLILDEKVVLVDFVKAAFTDKFMDNIRAILGDRKIDMIICNHVEPDHSGALPTVVDAYPDAVIYGTSNALKELSIYYPQSKLNFNIVRQGDSLCTGKYNFQFIPMPMVHWPDSMSTYLAEEEILFSNDAFGQHLGTGELFDNQIELDFLLARVGDYYANIVLPFGSQVVKLATMLSNYSIKLICPSHGLILKDTIPAILEHYKKWATNTVINNKAVIVYDTMWGTTAKLANKISEDFKLKGIESIIINLGVSHFSYAMAELLDAKYVCVGSPTLNNNMMPSVAAFITYMRGLKPKNRVGLAFGSYGWSGESITQINDILSNCGFEMQQPMRAIWNI